MFTIWKRGQIRFLMTRPLAEHWFLVVLTSFENRYNWAQMVIADRFTDVEPRTKG
jgi:hypothetical protein